MNYEIYISQAIAILFTWGLAKLNAVAVIHFENFGVTPLQQAKFHRYNNWAKFAFCLLAAATGFPIALNMGFAGLLSFLWIYLVFDIALNKSRPGRGWDYMGENDADGRRWIKLFGSRAGEAKALTLFGFIAIINTLNIILR